MRGSVVRRARQKLVLPACRAPLPVAMVLGLALLTVATACTGGDEPTATATPAARATPTATSGSSGPIDVSFGQHTLTAGAYRYSLGPRTTLYFDVPAGLRLTIGGQIRSEGSVESFGLHLEDLDSRSWITIDLQTGREWNRWIDPAANETGAHFDALAASARVSPPPAPTATPRPAGTDAAPGADDECGLVIDATHRSGALAGGHTYLESLRTGPPTPPFVTFYVPTGASLSYSGLDTRNGTLYLKEATSESKLIIDLVTGEEVERELLPVPPSDDLDVGAAFDQIVSSVRFNEMPSTPGCPETIFPQWEHTIGPGSYRYHGNPEQYHGVHPLPHVVFDVPEELELRVEWDERHIPFGIRLTNVETGSWLCLNAELVEECGRSVARSAEHLEPLFEQITRSLRPGIVP